MKKIYYYNTCIGRIGIAEENGIITNVTFADKKWKVEETETIKKAKKQLDEYFEGKRKNFDLPTKLEGTEFQLKVWNELKKIPYGHTASYKEIAEAVGCPNGYRAVGMANNRNPIAIIYPCHRVIGADGSLTGYGGGIGIKEKLLSLEIKYSKSMAVGVDIGGTAVKIGIFYEDGSVLTKTEIPTRHEDNCANVLSDTAAAIKKLIAENMINAENITGIGIGMPGPVAGGVVKHCVNLHWKNSVDVSEIMENLTGIKSVTINDANAAAAGELWMGGGKEHESMILVTIGTGIGGGIVIKNNILEGSNGSGGELGHIMVEYENGRECNCGRKGCLETYASATGIVRTAEELLNKDNKPSLLRNGILSAKSVFDAASAGDDTAIKAVDIFGRYLGIALVNAAATVDPEIIVLAGGVARAGEILRRIVEKYYRLYAFKTVSKTQIVLAELENDAGMYGAAREAFKLKDNL